MPLRLGCLQGPVLLGASLITQRRHNDAASQKHCDHCPDGGPDPHWVDRRGVWPVLLAEVLSQACNARMGGCSRLPCRGNVLEDVSVRVGHYLLRAGLRPGADVHPDK